MKPTPHALITLKQFLIQGLLGCLIGTLIGYSNVMSLSPMLHDRPGHPFYWLALYGFCGIIAGAIHGGFLRCATRPAPLWLALSALGWSFVGFLHALLVSSVTTRVDVLQVSSATTPTGHVITVGLLLGGLAALPQWLLLRRSIPFAACWLALSAIAWSISGVILRLLYQGIVVIECLWRSPS
jgi:hypothetical protein